MSLNELDRKKCKLIEHLISINLCRLMVLLPQGDHVLELPSRVLGRYSLDTEDEACCTETELQVL